jgi:hypothetical protein
MPNNTHNELIKKKRDFAVTHQPCYRESEISLSTGVKDEKLGEVNGRVLRGEVDV